MFTPTYQIDCTYQHYRYTSRAHMIVLSITKIKKYQENVPQYHKQTQWSEFCIAIFLWIWIIRRIPNRDGLSKADTLLAEMGMPKEGWKSRTNTGYPITMLDAKPEGHSDPGHRCSRKYKGSPHHLDCLADSFLNMMICTAILRLPDSRPGIYSFEMCM